MPLGDLPAWLPRDVVKLLFDNGWTKVDNLLKMACTVDAESSRFPHAWHWNDPADGGDGSTDWGMFQLNDGNHGGHSPVLDANGVPVPVAGGTKSLADVKAFAARAMNPSQAVLIARAMYEDRGFSPWYGYRQPNGNEPWRLHINVMAGAVGNFLRVMYGVPPV